MGLAPTTFWGTIAYGRLAEVNSVCARQAEIERASLILNELLKVHSIKVAYYGPVFVHLFRSQPQNQESFNIEYETT